MKLDLSSFQNAAVRPTYLSLSLLAVIRLFLLCEPKSTCRLKSDRSAREKMQYSSVRHFFDRLVMALVEVMVACVSCLRLSAAGCLVLDRDRLTVKPSVDCESFVTPSVILRAWLTTRTRVQTF